MKFQIHRFWRDDFKNFVKDEGVIVSRLKKISRERERGARQRGCTLAVIQVSGRRTDKGWAWRSARAFCGGIDYSLLSRCTGRVKSTPLPASLSHLLFQRSPLYLISTLLFFLPSPRFSPHPAHFLLPHISLAASWLTCEPSWITGEQSH